MKLDATCLMLTRPYDGLRRIAQHASGEEKGEPVNEYQVYWR
jgi:hypothetical protein